MNEKALEKILNIFLKEVLPLTAKGVAKGSKIFGAAIIKKDGSTKLAIYDDASTSYDEDFLNQYSKDVLRFRITGGIERSRARSFRDFLYIHTDYDLFYMTDNDTIHDPNFLNTLRKRKR